MVGVAGVAGVVGVAELCCRGGWGGRGGCGGLSYSDNASIRKAAQDMILATSDGIFF